MTKRTYIRRKIYLFSIAFFSLILIIGSVAFIVSMVRNAHIHASRELIRNLELEKIKLESSVINEINIVLKMAGSPLIQRFFANPFDPDLEIMAREEIAAYRSAFNSNIIFWANDIDKVFWFNEEISNIVDPFNPDEYWYNMTLYRTESYNFNINYNPEINMTSLWINAPVFDASDNRRPIGMVGTGIDLTLFIDSIYQNYKSDGELYFFNNFNEITGARDASLVSEKVKLDTELREIGFEILSRVRSLQSGTIDFFDMNEYVIVLSDVPALNWYIAAVLPITIADVLDDTITFLFISMMTVIALIFIIFCLFITSLLQRSTFMANQIYKSLEENDLSLQIEVKTRDELGELMTGIGNFLEKLKSAFTLFTQNASMVSAAVYDISSSTREITTTANEQSASVAEIVSTMENNKNLSVQVADKTVEVAELADETQNLSRHGASLHDENDKMMQDIRNQNYKIVDDIKNLHDVLSRIDESVQLIDTIADRTKLIAFNAALEASSSGEAGLRFAVVASEIRRFADNVVESVNEIKERITELQSASESLISEADIGSKAIEAGSIRIHEQKEVFKEIVDVSQNVAERSQQISDLSKQQELAAEQVFIALKEISLGVKQFVIATESTSETAQNLNSMSEELKETLSQYRITG